MSEIIITDYALKCAAAEYREAMLAALPKPSDCEHEFSAGYIEKREQLIRRTHRRKNFSRCMRNVAAVFLVLILGSGVFLGVNSEARADFLAWLRSAYENSIIYRFVGETTEAPLPLCELTWVPEGYELVTSERDEDSHVMVYENGEGNAFIFICSRMTENSILMVDETSGSKMRKIELNGIKGGIYITPVETGTNDLILFDDNGFVYSIDGLLEESVIMHIAENLKIAK